MDNFSLIFFLNLVFFASLLLFRNVFIPLIITVGFLAGIFWLIKNNKLRPEQLQVPFPKIALNSINYISGVVCLVFFLILESYIGFNSALLSAFFLFSHLNKLDSRAGFSMALIILIITAVLSISKNLKAAEEMAILAYYFLIVGAVWATIELRRDEAEENEALPEPTLRASTQSEFRSAKPCTECHSSTGLHRVAFWYMGKIIYRI